MSFSATLYDCSDDPRKIGKGLTSGVSVSSIIPTESCDILTPTFILNYDSAYASKNYCYVGTPFDRFYFITDMKIDIGKKITITCQVDPLETYKDSIKNLTTTIYRTQLYSDSAPYLADEEYTVKSGFQAYTDVFKSSGSIPSFGPPGIYVLSWVGNEKIDSDKYVPVYVEPSDWSTSWGDYFFKDESGVDVKYYPLTVLYPTQAPDFDEARYEIRHDYNSDIYEHVP